MDKSGKIMPLITILFLTGFHNHPLTNSLLTVSADVTRLILGPHDASSVLTLHSE